MPEPADTKPAIDESKIGAAVASGLKGQFDAILQAIKQPAAAPAEQKPATDAELDAWVAKGQISQAQADAHRRDRDRKALKAEVLTEVKADLDTRERAGSVGAKIARYRELQPALNDENSEISKRCAAAYAEMIADGLPQGNQTALAAARAVLGPLDALEAAQTRGRRETHEETGGSGGSAAAPEPSGAPAGLLKGIPNRQREFWAEGIKSGLYKSWDDPEIAEEAAIIRRKSRAN